MLLKALGKRAATGEKDAERDDRDDRDVEGELLDVPEPELQDPADVVVLLTDVAVRAEQVERGAAEKRKQQGSR